MHVAAVVPQPNNSTQMVAEMFTSILYCTVWCPGDEFTKKNFVTVLQGKLSKNAIFFPSVYRSRANVEIHWQWGCEGVAGNSEYELMVVRWWCWPWCCWQHINIAGAYTGQVKFSTIRLKNAGCSSSNHPPILFIKKNFPNIYFGLFKVNSLSKFNSTELICSLSWAGELLWCPFAFQIKRFCIQKSSASACILFVHPVLIQRSKTAVSKRPKNARAAMK